MQYSAKTTDALGKFQLTLETVDTERYAEYRGAPVLVSLNKKCTDQYRGSLLQLGRWPTSAFGASIWMCQVMGLHKNHHRPPSTTRLQPYKPNTERGDGTLG